MNILGDICERWLRRLFGLLAVCVVASAQTTITGRLTDATGQPQTCVIKAKPLSVPAVGPGEIIYTAVIGDLTGSHGGYGDGNANIYAHLPFSLLPGLYRTTLRCDTPLERNTSSYMWTVPFGTVTIQGLLGFIPPTSTLSWNLLTSGQWASLTSSQWSTLTQ